MPHNYRKKLIGKRFGMLVVQSFSRIQPNGKHTLWNCVCDCGRNKEVRGGALRAGHTISCGHHTNPLGKQHWKFRGYEGLSLTRYHHIKKDAKLRHIEFSVSIRYLWKLFVKQKERCVFTGEKLKFPEKTKSVGTASLDRIDSSRGYIPGNVQWVHRDINYAKQSLSSEDFINLCKKVVNHSILPRLTHQTECLSYKEEAASATLAAGTNSAPLS